MGWEKHAPLPSWVQREGETRSSADLRICPDMAAVTMDYPLHSGQANTGSRKLF